ncbi:MAG: signal peptidase II [Bdellovibrionales bacterium]
MARDLFSIGTYLTALVALTDQLSKHWFLSVSDGMPKVMRVSSFLNFRLSWNKGVTFGLMNNLGVWMPYILIGVTLIILLLLFNWLRKARTMYAALGLGLVMGGAIGNVIDRLRFGAVVDFIDFHYAGYHWYTFNVADSAIVLGVGLLLLENFIMSRKSGKG